MDSKEILLYGLIGGAAALAGFHTYRQTGITAAIIVIFTVSYLLYRFSDPSRAWDSFKLSLNPFMFSVVSALTAFTASSILGHSLKFSTGMGIAFLFIGGVTSTIIHKYWNIGG